MGTTSLTFQVSGVSELIGQIEKIQSKMAGLDMSMSKAQLSSEMSRVERLVKEASTFANTLYTSLNKIENVNVQKTADGLQKVGKEAVDSSGKVVESSNKMASAMTKSTESVTKAAKAHASAHKSVADSASSAGKLMDHFAGSISSVVMGYASIQTAISAVNAAFQENKRIIQEAQASMENYAKVSGQLGQKAETGQQLGEYKKVVDQLATAGAVANREEGMAIAYAMLSANMPISEVEKMTPALQAGLFSSSDLSGIIKAAGPLMNRNKGVTLNQLMSMSATASRANVSDTAKIVQSVAAADMMSNELGWELDESFALSDVIARATPNADEAKVWQKNFTKDVWKKVVAKVAEAKMLAIDPNAKTMPGFISGYDSKGKPIADPNFKITFSEFGQWAKEYYGQDMNRVKSDFADIRGSQGALAVINSLLTGEFDESLANVRKARQNDVVGQKAKMTLAFSPEIRARNAKLAAQARADIANEAEAAIGTFWTVERQNFRNASGTIGGRFGRDFQNISNAWLNPSSWTTEGQVRQMWNSPYLTAEQKRDVIYNYARANPDLNVQGGLLTEKNAAGAARQTDGFYTAVWQAQQQVKSGATQYTPVSGPKGYDEKAVVDMAKAAENAADALNKAADAADKAATKLQNQVTPTPGQTGQLAPATI